MLSRKIGTEFFGIKAVSAEINSLDRVIKALGKCEFFAQAFSPRVVASAEQVFFAYEQTQYALLHNQSMLNDARLEFLLRITGKRQVKGALEGAEIRGEKGVQKILLACAGKNKKNLAQNFKVLEKEFDFKPLPGNVDLFIRKNAKKNCAFIRKFYGINDAELKAFGDGDAGSALAEAVLERNALLALE
ncbi:hypothetical protein KKH30_01620 [Candidatus Micrarchaeota archaeon]|nr:hypothetical protein [Candidatus Micrarchaeota archaeon]MBU1939439.1 hypothetical protein [Candidatus Micrarchaeota archaeon]